MDVLESKRFGGVDSDERNEKQEQTPPVNTEGFLHIDEQSKRWKSFFSSGPYSSMLSAGTIGGFLMNSGSFFVDDPYLLNQRIKQLKSTAKFMEREQIENALLDIDHNEQTLREATHSALNMTYPCIDFNIFMKEF